MASKEAGETSQTRPRSIRLAEVTGTIATVRDFTKKRSKMCEVNLEKLALHPKSPDPDSFIRELSEEDISGPLDRVLSGWKNVEFEYEDFEKHIDDFESEVESFNSETDALLEKEPPRATGGLWKIVKAHFKQTRKSGSKGATEQEKAEKRKTVTNRLREFVHKEYDHLKHLKKNIKKVLGSKVPRSPRSTIPKTNTPVEEDAAANKIAEMVQDVHIVQLTIKILECKVNEFEKGFGDACMIYSPTSSGMVNPDCSEKIIEDAKDLMEMKYAADLMATKTGTYIENDPLFRECSKEYEKQQRADIDARDKSKDETGKIQRKRLPSDTHKELNPSPAKCAKQESGSTWQEPKVGKLVDIDSPDEKKSAISEKPKTESDDDSKEGISTRMRSTSMEDLI